jgi:hypothetical protein
MTALYIFLSDNREDAVVVQAPLANPKVIA